MTPITRAALFCVLCLTPLVPARAAEDDVRFNTNFEGGSLGKIEHPAPNTFRCFVRGQYDQRGHNRQTTWYSFRLDNAKDKPLTITLTDLVGEYNDKPGSLPYGPDIVPVFSTDGRTWRHFDASQVAWDAQAKEATLTFTPTSDPFWVAHIPPYTPTHLKMLLNELRELPNVKVTEIGKTLGWRDIPMVVVTDAKAPDEGKRGVWLQARQHAWEAGTSWVMEGALRFITSDDPKAVELRKRTVFRFTPMVDVDGCVNGGVRFNANGWDVNRHWPSVDFKDRVWLDRSPEIWHTKSAIVAAMAGPAPRIDLMVNMHNTETNEYLESMCDDPATLKVMQAFYDRLVERTSFDPSKKFDGRRPSTTTNSLWATHRVPVMLMEQRIATGKKLGRRPTVEDRLKFGRELIEAMAEVVGEARP